MMTREQIEALLERGLHDRSDSDLLAAVALSLLLIHEQLEKLNKTFRGPLTVWNGRDL